MDDEALRDIGEELIKQADAMAEAESKQDMARNAFTAGWSILANIFFTNEIDFVTKLLIVLFLVSLSIMFIYLAVPMSIRRKFEKLDYDASYGGLSVSAGLSLVSALLLGVNKM